MTSDVADFLARARPAGGVVAMTDLAVHGDRVAVTAAIPETAGHDPVRRVAVMDGGTLTAEGTGEASHGPRWSPDGTRLAWIAARSSGSAVVVSDRPAPVAHRTRPVDDVVEAVRWSPDGTRLLLVAAGPGAQLSDVVGSGTLPERGGDAGWRPSVQVGRASAGWRRAWVWDLATDDLTQVSPTDLNVWQAEWCGDGRIVLVVSDGPTESDWYDASLVELDPATGARRRLPVPDGQLARAACDPSGAHVSVIVGPMSDRGIDVGQLVVDGRVVDVGGVDVTDQTWTGADEVVFAGLRGLVTVVGRYEPSTGTMTVVSGSTDTCGEHGPQLAAHGERIVAWVHGYARSPALVDLAAGGEQVLWRAGDPTPPVGRLERMRWPSSDRAEIEGLLVVPDGPGPFPLIVHVHGGPVWAWRDEWSMHYPYTPLLVGRGFAVLHPNHRGSSGRGADFVRDGLHDLGGLDADDIVAGVDALVAAGRIDGARVGVTGNSYGGFMATWLAATSDRFQAVNARSPVTDWLSQHLTSNLPAFDELCLRGPVLDPDSDYRRRSPLHRADAIAAELLLMAGARDLATPPQQAVMVHRALTERGHPSTLVLYPEEGHGVRSYHALVDQCERMLAFFTRVLG